MTAAGATRKKLQEPGPFGSPVRVPITREEAETYAQHGRDPGFWEAVLRRADSGDIVFADGGTTA